MHTPVSTKATVKNKVDVLKQPKEKLTSALPRTSVDYRGLARTKNENATSKKTTKSSGKTPIAGNATKKCAIQSSATASIPSSRITPGDAQDGTAFILFAPQISKQDRIITLLRNPGGASIAKLMEATGWQAHSVRGYISGTLRKRLALKVVFGKVEGINHYRIESTK